MSTDNQFAGKLLQIFVAEPACGGTFENVRIDRVGGHEFLVGTLIAHPYRPDLRVGLPFWIPIDAVQMIVEFPDLDSVLKYIEGYRHPAEEEKSEVPSQRRWWRR
jgi:hypothetical protein